MAAETPTETGPHWLTRRQLADLLGLHMQTITKLERSGLPIVRRGRKGRPSQYDEAAVRAWLQAREEAKKQSADGPLLDLGQERAKRERAQRLLAEQTYQVRSRELVSAAAVTTIWTRHITAARSRILGVPHRLKRADPSFSHQQLALVDQFLRAALEDLANGADGEDAA